MRRAVLITFTLLAACTQTDVIAREGLDRCADFGLCDDAQNCSAVACDDLSTTPATCDDTRARALAGDGCSQEEPFGSVSRFALCACTDFVSDHVLSTESWDSSADAGALMASASVAVNGGFRSRGVLDVQGAVLVGQMYSVADDATATPPRDGVLEHAEPACACDAASFLDVAALVAARADDNENTKLSFDPASLDGFELTAGAPALELPCGRYHVPTLHGSGALRFHVRGHVELFVAGDIALDDALQVELDADSSLDLFVAGNLRVSGKLTLGAAASAGNVRVYIGGSGTIDLSQDALIAGALYAPRAELVTRAPLTVYGSIFVRRAAPGADLSIRYDQAARAANSCR